MAIWWARWLSLPPDWGHISTIVAVVTLGVGLVVAGVTHSLMKGVFNAGVIVLLYALLVALWPLLTKAARCWLAEQERRDAEAAAEVERLRVIAEAKATSARVAAEREAEVSRLERSEPPWAAFLGAIGKLRFYDLERAVPTDAEWAAWREALDESRRRAEEIEERLRPAALQFIERLAAVPRESVGSGFQAYDNFDRWMMIANAAYVDARRQAGLPVPDRSST